MAVHDQVQYFRLRSLGADTNSTLSEDHAVDFEESSKKKHRIRTPRINFKKLMLLLSLILNFVWGLKVLLLHPDGRTLTYSPASNVIVNERVVFSSAFGIEQSPFQGEPNEKNNRLWEGLYDFGITRISAQEARPMDNKTLPVPDESGGYVIQLAVFHQLHCLNLIRKGVYGSVDMSNQDNLMGIEHLDHCIDMLRQSIMCNSDVTPITFARKTLKSPMKVVAEVVHTCRSFSKIQQWAWNRRIHENFDKSKVITDDPLGWGTYIYVP